MKVRYLIEFLFFKIFKFILFFLPRKYCLLLGGLLGRFYFYLDKRRRQIALSNLASAFPNQKNSFGLKKIALNSAIHFGRVFFDLTKNFFLTSAERDSLIEVKGKKNLHQAIKQGKGIIFFTAHYGNWEIAPWFISRYGKLNVIARPLDNPYLEKEVIKLRSILGSNIIYKKNASKKVLRALKNKEMVAILIDQNVMRNQAVFVDFFGKKAATTPSLATFHLRTGVPIVPLFCYPQEKNKYKLIIYPPLGFLLTNNFRQDVLQITQKCTKIIENEIKKNPQYWLWFHQRWRTRSKE
ncbi:MAG: lysophospholipid acyltransferase family protein [Candidatus Aminicenantia bacterium]